MNSDIASYSTLIFDCDGVVLNSNRIKTEAFLSTALPYGEDAANALVAHHISHGGISRYSKFKYFIKNILPKYQLTQELAENMPGLDALLLDFASIVKTELMKCEVTGGLAELREITANSRWLIASGSDQRELREIFVARNLDHLFNGGIFGSPDSKHNIVKRVLDSGRITQPVLFLGDSKLDHEVAQANKLDFVFVSQWTEFTGWEEYCKYHNISVIRSVGDLIQFK